MTSLTINDVARVCHEANRAVQLALGEENPSAPWDETSVETQDSAVDGVRNALSGATPEQSHENWLKFKLDHGWVFGPVKDESAKTHPLIVPYADLPEEQRVKDDLFIAIVKALS